jgi:O-antigen/teichoic acid export membrane protein
LTQAAARSMFWVSAQTLTTKLGAFAAQLLLARILEPEEFGTYSLALSICLVSVFLPSAALRDLIVRAGENEPRIVGTLFWSGWFSGLFASFNAVLLACTYQLVFPSNVDPSFPLTVLVFSLLPCGNTIAQVPTGMLQSRLQFRLLSIIATVRVLADTSMRVVLAMYSFGVMSLIIPQAVFAGLNAFILCWIVRRDLRFDIGWAKLRQLMPPAFLMTIVQSFLVGIETIDYAIIGSLQSKEVLGRYFMAYTLAVQPMYFLSLNLSQVSLSLLAKLNDDPKRQRAAFNRGLSTASAVIAPACFLQACLAPVLIMVFFEEKWWSALPAFQILSLAMAFRPFPWMICDFLKARGRFWQAVTFSGLSFVGFSIVVLLTALLWPIEGTAAGILVFYLLLCAGGLVFVLRDPGAITTVYRPAIFCLIAFGPTLILSCGQKWSRFDGSMFMLVAASGLSLAAYAFALKTWMRPAWDYLVMFTKKSVPRG